MSSRARLRAKLDLTSKLDTCQLYQLKIIPEILFAKSLQSGFIDTYSEADSTIETSLQINSENIDDPNRSLSSYCR